MEHIIRLHIDKLPEGYYLATSDDVQGLVVQAKTVQELLTIAKDVAQKLLEAQTNPVHLPVVTESFDIPLVVGAI